MDEPKYIWSEEPAGWGRAQRKRFDRIFFTLFGDERLAAALRAFRAGEDLADSNTLLVEVATLLAAKGFGHLGRLGRRHAAHRT